MRRCVRIRCAIVVAVLAPFPMLWSSSPILVWVNGPSPRIARVDPETIEKWDADFRKLFERARCGANYSRLSQSYEFKDLTCTPDEVALAHEAVAEIDPDDPLWKDCWLYEPRHRSMLLSSGELVWNKWRHPLDTRKQIWIAVRRDRDGGTVFLRARIGF